MRYLATLVFVFLLVSSWGWAQNVLVFTSDSTRADRFGVYGYKGGTTPNIDAWAKTGMVFDEAYSTSAWTAPGLVSILTGLYPPTHGVNNRDHMGPRDLQTLIKIFQARGYQTPNLNFFTFAPYYSNLGLPDVSRKYFGSREGEELLNWLDENAGSDKPFFVFYHSTIVHQPYNPGADRLPAPLEQLEQSAGIRAVLNGAIVPIGSVEFLEADKATLDQLYDAEIQRMDELFGDALALLREKGQLENTLILLTADHGEELLDHGFIGHASTSLQAKMYQEVTRIPLIMSWPGKVPQGRRVDARVSQVDIFPTVLELFELDIPEQRHGESLLSAQGRERPIYMESVISGNQTTKEHGNLWVRAVIKEDFKYISPGELYNLRSDPGERSNIAEQRPETVAELSGLLEGWRLRTIQNRADFFDNTPETFRPSNVEGCPTIFTPGDKSTLDFDVHTGTVLLDWRGDRNTNYLIQYRIGTGDHYIAGVFEVQGNHQVVGPLSRELWRNLKAWNPFSIRIAPRTSTPCWSGWVTFEF